MAITPHQIGMTPQLLVTTPHQMDITPHQIGMTPQRLVITPHQIGITLHRMGITPQRLDITPLIMTGATITGMTGATITGMTGATITGMTGATAMTAIIVTVKIMTECVFILEVFNNAYMAVVHVLE